MPESTYDAEGACRAESRANKAGNKPSRAAAMAIWPAASKVVLMQPAVDTSAPTTTIANPADQADSYIRRYAARILHQQVHQANGQPITVAREMVLPEFTISSAGT